MRHFLHTISGFILACMVIIMLTISLFQAQPEISITGDEESQAKSVVAIVLVLSAGAIFIGSKDNSLYD